MFKLKRVPHAEWILCFQFQAVWEQSMQFLKHNELGKAVDLMGFGLRNS
jgi:hypothetical protein